LDDLGSSAIAVRKILQGTLRGEGERNETKGRDRLEGYKQPRTDSMIIKTLNMV
jgi:hypothetical protein